MHPAPPPYPLRFKPIFKESIWGGRSLTRLGKRLPPGKKIGESWEIADRTGSATRVAHGPLAGKTLADLVRDFPAWLLGERAARSKPGRFPLLVKWIGAEDLLSVQVHPDGAACRGSIAEPKNECWHVVKTKPGAFLYCGLKRGVSWAALAAALRSPGDRAVERLLRRITVKAGDTIDVPAGTIHAIGAGIVLAEVQQNSDTTYRLHDWGRVGADGKPRPLHVEEGLRAACLGGPCGKRKSVANPFFSLRPLSLSAPRTLRCQETFALVGGLSGTARVEAGGAAEALRKGNWLLIPAAAGTFTIEPTGSCRVLAVRGPRRLL